MPLGLRAPASKRRFVHVMGSIGRAAVSKCTIVPRGITETGERRVDACGTGGEGVIRDRVRSAYLQHIFSDIQVLGLLTVLERMKEAGRRRICIAFAGWDDPAQCRPCTFCGAHIPQSRRCAGCGPRGSGIRAAANGRFACKWRGGRCTFCRRCYEQPPRPFSRRLRQCRTPTVLSADQAFQVRRIQ